MKLFYKNIHVASEKNVLRFKINNNNVMSYERRRKNKEKLNNQPKNIISYDSFNVING